MPRRFVGITVVGLALFAGPHASVRPPAADLSGVALDATTRQPVAGAVVSLRRVIGGDTLPRMVTDARGRFVFPDLPAADDYYLEATASGYAPSRNGWTSPSYRRTTDTIRRIAVADGQWLGDLTVPMWRLGVISGRVTDERDEPIVGVVVQAFSWAAVSGTRQPVGGPLARTDDRGVYRIADLMPGRYAVCVLSVQSTTLDTRPGPKQVGGIGFAGTADAVVMATAGVDVDGRHRLVLSSFATPPPPSSSASRAYPATFYPAASLVHQAAPLDIDYGDHRAGVDVRLQPALAVRVSGRIDPDADVTPPPTLVLRLMTRGQEMLGFGAEAATTMVKPDGTFTFLNVPAGDYTLLAQSSVTEFATGPASARLPAAMGFPMGSASMGSSAGAPGLTRYSVFGPARPGWGRVGVTVGDRDLSDVLVPFHRNVAIRGRIAFAEGVTPPAALTAYVEPMNGDPSLGNPFARAQFEQPAGSAPFAIQGLMGGTYQLAFYDFVPVSVMSAGRDVKDVGFDGSAGRDFTDVVVTLTNRVARVRGLVRDDRGPATAAVLVFPVERERWTNYGWSPSRLKSVVSGSNGAFLVDTLPEGDYFVIAVDPAKADAWVDAAFLASAAPLATRISVKWNETVSVALSLSTVVLR